jgi:hypothetical protein
VVKCENNLRKNKWKKSQHCGRPKIKRFLKANVFRRIRKVRVQKLFELNSCAVKLKFTSV